MGHTSRIFRPAWPPSCERSRWPTRGLRATRTTRATRRATACRGTSSRDARRSSSKICPVRHATFRRGLKYRARGPYNRRRSRLDGGCRAFGRAGRGTAAGATWKFRGAAFDRGFPGESPSTGRGQCGCGSTRGSGQSPRRRVVAPPRPRRGEVVHCPRKPRFTERRTRSYIDAKKNRARRRAPKKPREKTIIGAAAPRRTSTGRRRPASTSWAWL